MAGFQAVTAVTITGAFVFGMVLTLVGSIKQPLAKRLGIDETRVGGLLSALNLSLIPMMLLSGLLCDSWGPGVIIILGSLLSAIAIFALTLRRSYALSVALFLVIGLGGACVSTGSVVLMPRAFPGASMAASLNLGNVFFGLGALVTPALADLLLRTVDFRRTLGLLAVICLGPALLAALMLSGQAAENPVPGDLGQVLHEPMVWLAGLMFLFYAPLEWSVGTWATKYLTEHNWMERRAAWVLSGFWLAFLGARLLMAYLQDNHVFPEKTDVWVVLVLALAAAVALGNLAGASSRGNSALGLILLGITLGPIFPTLVGMLFDKFPVGRGTAYGAMFAIGSTGSLFFPPLIGFYARRKSVQYALRVPMVMCLLLTGVALVVGMALNL